MPKTYVRYILASGKETFNLTPANTIILYVDSHNPAVISESAVCDWAYTHFIPADIRYPFVIVSGPEVVMVDDYFSRQLEQSKNLIPNDHCII